MYQPPKFKEERPEVLHDLIRSHPLGLLITSGSSGLNADLVPFLIDAERGVLQAHISRANPQMKALAEATECLVVFQGPEAYITPSWYEEKQLSGRVVPTWNYAIVQVYGRPLLMEDAEWIRTQITALTEVHEGKRSEPWAVSDAPEEYVQAQIKGIVGIEVEIDRLEGKWKVSQNRPEGDRVGVYEGLTGEGDVKMADMVAEWGGLPRSV